MNPWIAQAFGGTATLTGHFAVRTHVELPRLVHDATGTDAKYAFYLEDGEAPVDPRVAFVNVAISDLVSTDAFGGGIQSSAAPGAYLYLSNVSIEPNWPMWESYQTTNYDGIVLDGSEALYAENLTISNWNADSAMDIKSNEAQLVCLETSGDGNRTLRFWRAGPHYIVNSSVNNGTGDIVWISDCDTTEIRVFDSTFNGEPTIPADKMDCDGGTTPNIVYLDTDPRTTGEMHPMLSQ